MRRKLKRVTAGRDRPSARDHNQMAEMLEASERSTGVNAIRDTDGLHTRRGPVTGTAEVSDLTPVAWWHFFSEEARDASGEDNHGTLVNSPSAENDVLLLNPSDPGDTAWDQYVQFNDHIGDFSGLAKGSVCFWFKWPEQGGDGAIFTLNKKSAGAGFSILNADGDAKMVVNVSGTLYAKLPEQYDDQKWHHFAYTTDATGNKIYIDGIPVTPSYTTGSAGTQAFFADVDDPDAIAIGCLQGTESNTQYANVAVNDFRIYDVALTDGQVHAVYEEYNSDNQQANQVFGSMHIFVVVTQTNGQGVYNCARRVVLEENWDNTAGAAKIGVLGGDSFEVLNLQEYDPVADSADEYEPELKDGDLIAAFRVRDDRLVPRWVGFPLAPHNRVRLAYCKTDAPAGDTITCYLDVDETGEEITVQCEISCAVGSASLQKALPYLMDGVCIKVVNIKGTWHCLQVFQYTDICPLDT